MTTRPAKTLLSFLLAFTFSGLLHGQAFNPADPPPFDPAVKKGKLENGMTYYIRANQFPANRAEFYLLNLVGAIEEEDDQNGLAHFTEHMAFNGTRHFPNKQMLDYLATIGVKFGQNVNAGTGVEQTIYNLSNLPLLREGIIDTGLLILHDWSHCLAFDPEEIELERGVILEEWRVYGSASERMDNQLAPVVYKNSKYAKRDIIGDTAVLRHFPHQRIKDFYTKWYRPDLQAIVIVGDVDVAQIESKLRVRFADIPAPAQASPKVVYPVPDNSEPLVGVATDPEATTTEVSVVFKHPATDKADKNLGYMRLQFVRGLINTMFGQRMSELSMRENPPFTRAYSYYGGFVKARDAFNGLAQARDNESLTALNALLTEMERMKRHGFTQGELERAKASTTRNYESRYLEREKRKNRELVYPIIGHFLRDNPNPGIAFEHDLAQTLIPGISLEEINNTAAAYVTDNNMIVTVTGPRKEGIRMPTTDEILRVIASFKNNPIEAYQDQMAGKKLLEKEPLPGKVIRESKHAALKTTEWTLFNGMKIIFKPTDFKADEILISAYSEGGLSLVADQDLPAASLLGQAVNDMGTGEFSKTGLSKLLAGKKVNVSLALNDNQEMIQGSCSPRDLETALELIYLVFTSPRWEETDFKTWLDKKKADLTNAAANPRKAFSDSILVMFNNHSKRNLPMTPALLESIDLNQMKRVYQERYGDPGDFTFQFIGNIDPPAAKALVEKYLGSLPGRKKRETTADNKVRPPKGFITNDFTRENKTPRTSVMVNYNGTAGYAMQEKLLAAALRHCLELRYIESIREDEGGTYSVRVSLNLNPLPEPSYMLNVAFDTDPLKADKLIRIVHHEIKEMLANGPREADLQKAREYFLKQRQEDLRENNWWSRLLFDYYTTGLDFYTLYEEKVKKLDAPGLQAYARELFDQGNVIEVIMRPR